ncbi:DUF6180 family protein [Agrobacterium larrymoorei]|uniref:DUF6180 family protein n=1 Tax=Agrobacterium larrymoorei TaxID=160699 RepID=A0A4D7DTM8_9HYPH|nr:DUF6180 family protein [Agrobacterium larrymoorei]QCJ00252.1 hypothetical protein CFBP5473_20210 [Agrobacterium larrymoorei]QYA09306.1 hypothetical protein J5285_18145 [Agrobacterium larrymoorei]WHA43314.1 DUF6180 family protein [Agrobacterium larrymoorei]
MSKALTLALSATASLLGFALSVSAQSKDFNLTYHVERTPEAALDIETCGAVVEKAAAKVGLDANVQSFPGQLVLVSGGKEGRGVFTVQCIAVENMTVSVVQGIDYRNQKGALGKFADNVQTAIMAAKK